MSTLSAIWKDLLPGLIAAGLLAAAESILLGQSTLWVPITGLLAAGTVYAADHRVAPDGKARCPFGCSSQSPAP